jgi:ferredoxin-nitrite reductase
MINHDNGFTETQKQYLQGFMTGAMQRQAARGGEVNITNGNPIPETQDEIYFGVPLDDLSKEERFKHDENPLDIWDKLVKHADDDTFPSAEAGDVFRFKFHGLFYVAPAQDAFMLRCRLVACTLSSTQLRGLAQMASEWGGGFCDVTTRANVQIRQFPPRHIVNVLTRLSELGLTSRGAGADNVRNITITPTSGLDPNELYDVRGMAKALHFYILNNRDLFGLPRKFNIAFDSGGAISVVADTNDIGFVAVRANEDVYFRVELGGITGHQTFAQDCGLLLKPDECVPVAAAMIRVFNEHGDRTDRKKARLKYLLERWGVPKFVEETQKKLAFEMRRFPREQCAERHEAVRHAHIGVHVQKQAGLNYIGVAVPVGRLTAAQMVGLADVAEQCGSGELRCTVWQNVLIANVPDANVSKAKTMLRELGLRCEASFVEGGLVACTGNTGCKFAASNTKGQAMYIAHYLNERITLDQSINIHLTGCAHSCAQHYIGDIGLLGTQVESSSNGEGYHVFVGGGEGSTQGLARQVFAAIPFDEVPGRLEHMLRIYLAQREGHESFVAFTRRHSVETLKAMFEVK